MKPESRRPSRVVRWVFAALLSWLAPAKAALIDLDLVVTPGPGIFSYDVTVRNNSALDLTLVSILNAPLGDALIGPSLATPPGFVGLYDAGLGIIDLLEGSSVFGAGSVVGGFRFNSVAAPGAFFRTFEALDINGGRFAGATQVVGASVPDNSSTLLLAAAVFIALAGIRRFRFRVQA